MAVSLTVEQVKAQVRVVDVFNQMPIRPGVTSQRTLPEEFWTGKLAAVTALVERFAPEAPEAVQNEAALRAIAYLVDRFASRTMVSRQGYSGQSSAGANLMLAALGRNGAVVALESATGGGRMIELGLSRIKQERRQQSYTDVLVAALAAQAASLVDTGSTAAVEASAGLLARAFSAAEVAGGRHGHSGPSLRPSWGGSRAT